jgi:hypothetical protein
MKPTRNKIREMLKQQLPAYELVDDDSVADIPDSTALEASADTVAPTREALVAKYLGVDAMDAPALETADNEEFVMLEGRTEEGEIVRRAAVVDDDGFTALQG